MTAQKFQGWTLADFEQAFEVGRVTYSRDCVLITIDRDYDVIVSGNTYEYREVIKGIAARLGSYAKWLNPCWGIYTRRNPRMVAAVLEALGAIPGARYALKAAPAQAQQLVTTPSITTLNGYTLYPFQAEGVGVIVEAFQRGEKSFLLADEMGLGKTIQALGVCKVLGLDAVVIAPASVVPQWRSKAAECGIRAEVFSYAKAKQANADGKLLIIDEAHYVKNRTAQRSKAVNALAQQARHVLALTGTPLLNKIEELANIMENIHMISSAKDFLYEYASYEIKSFGHGERREYYLTSAQAARVRNYLNLMLPYLRRLKADVNLQLPAKVRTQVELDVAAKEATKALIAAAKEYAEKRGVCADGFSSDDALVEFVLNDLPAAAISTARRLYAIAKAGAAAEYISDLLDSTDKPILVFYHHEEVLRALQELAPGPYIDGSVSQERRAQLVEEFQAGKHRVLYLSITAAGVGLTLTAADTAVFVEYDWVPANLLQAEDRINRIGQTSTTTFYHYITTSDRIEKLLLKKLLEKTALAQSVLGGDALKI